MPAKTDLSALFLGNKSYEEIFELAKARIKKGGQTAGDALHTVYKNVTGRSHLMFKKINWGGYPVYNSKPDYENLANHLLRKLEEFARSQSIEEKETIEQEQTKDPILEECLKDFSLLIFKERRRGVDMEFLHEVGYV